MEVSLDKIVGIVVEEVVKELKRQGVTVVAGPSGGGSSSGASAAASVNASGLKTKSERIDMSKYKSPVLTERMLGALHPLTGEVVVPKGTILTPKAKELLRDNGIGLSFE